VTCLQDIRVPCIFALNAFLRGDAEFLQSFRVLHPDTAANIAMAVSAIYCYHHGIHAAGDGPERADLTANAWDVFNLVEVIPNSSTARCGFLSHTHGTSHLVCSTS
jgi:hypothetical protein